MSWPLPGWKTLASVVRRLDCCVCVVPIQAQEKYQEPEQDHRLGQHFQSDLQIHIGPKFLVWFPCVVKLRCLSFHWFVCFYYCLFVKTQGEHPSTQYLLGQRPWGACAYIENMYIYCASSVCWTWRLLSSPLGGLCCTQRILVFAKQSPHRCCLPGRSGRASTWQKAAVTTLFLSDQTASPLAYQVFQGPW